MKLSESINYRRRDHYIKESQNDDRRTSIREAIALLKSLAKDESVECISVLVLRDGPE